MTGKTKLKHDQKLSKTEKGMIPEFLLDRIIYQVYIKIIETYLRRRTCQRLLSRMFLFRELAAVNSII